MDQHTSYVIFDNAAGRILGTHSRLDGETGDSMAMSDEEVLAACGIPLDEKARATVKVLAVDSAALNSRRGMRVNTKRRELVPRDHVAVTPSRTEIRGDGEDVVDIEIRVVQPSGKLDDHFVGKLKVTTQRGRLSEPAGIVQARAGVAKIVLRSAAETIDRVRITARDVDGELDPGHTTVAFV